MKRDLTAAQRASFFGSWWPACCAVKGWHPKDEAKYRDHILEATTAFYKANGGALPTNSLSACTQAQLTAVFKLTWFKTDPDNLNTALPVANPVELKEDDERQRAVVALSRKAGDHTITETLLPLCRKHQVSHWHNLPARVLKSVMHWKQFNARRAAKPAPPAGTTGDEPSRTYQMRPSRKFIPKPSPQPVTVTADDENPY